MRRLVLSGLGSYACSEGLHRKHCKVGAGPAFRGEKSPISPIEREGTGLVTTAQTSWKHCQGQKSRALSPSNASGHRGNCRLISSLKRCIGGFLGKQQWETNLRQIAPPFSRRLREGNKAFTSEHKWEGRLSRSASGLSGCRRVDPCSGRSARRRRRWRDGSGHTFAAKSRGDAKKENITDWKKIEVGLRDKKGGGV